MPVDAGRSEAASVSPRRQTCNGISSAIRPEEEFSIDIDVAYLLAMRELAGKRKAHASSLKREPPLAEQLEAGIGNRRIVGAAAAVLYLL